MATPSSSSSSAILLILLASYFLSKTEAMGATNSATETHFHALQTSSLSPASLCSASSQGLNRKQTMEVVHQHGPCSELNRAKASATATMLLSDVLLHDQERVDSIQARVTRSPNTDRFEGEKVDLPAKSGRSLGSGNYIVTVGLGTPPKSLSLIFDTASDLSWTQCQPCARSCYQQEEPIFNPSLSTSYVNVSCSSAQCSLLSSATGHNPGCSSSSTCLYIIQYGDRSFTVGYLSRDKLTISSDVLQDFLFGCGQNNQGLFGSTAGLLGLGRDPLSVISQTSEKYGKYFSYCLPSTSSSTGHLTLGKSGVSENAKFTPLSSTKGRTFYFVDIIAISVGGHVLQIDQSIFKAAGSIVDSGTVITRLPPAAYTALGSAFRQLMQKYSSAPAFSILNTCYNFGNLTTVTVPTIAFTFSGDVKVDLAPSGILVAVGPTTACLAFAANNAATEVAIFGNTQQKTLEVVYDVAGGNLGFIPNGC